MNGGAMVISERIGRLRHRITFDEPESGDDWSDYPLMWNEVATCYADIRPRTARERSQGDRMDELAQYEIKIRYRTDIDEKMRIRHGSEILNIVGIVNVGQMDRWLLIDATGTGEVYDVEPPIAGESVGYGTRQSVAYGDLSDVGYSAAEEV